MKAVLIMLLFSVGVEANVLLKDIGVIGLASHDMFTWNRNTETNEENGRLDLSTIFDYENGKRWKKGGNPKNAENAPVYTVTMILVKFYKKEIKYGFTENAARKRTVEYFHAMIRESFPRMTGLDFPVVARNESVTNIEQAAMRGLHDILPGRVKLFNRRKKELKLTNLFKAKTFLNEAELNQPLANYNGDYDEEYKKINIPFSRKTIDLKKVDGEFIEKFSPYRHEDMLHELKLVGEGSMSINEVSFIHHLEELFSKGICSSGNDWIPQTTPCN